MIVCLLTGCGTVSASVNKKYEISSEQVKVYYKGQYGEDTDEITMYFLNGNNQIAYYDMDTVVSIMNKLYHDGYGDYEKDKDYSLTYEADKDKVTFTRENGYTMVADFTEDTITFVDYDKFISHSYDLTAVDLSHSSGFDEDGQAVYLQREKEGSFERLGKEYVFDLGNYDIDLIYQNSTYLIPAQTMNDILLTATYTEYLYNGECAIYVNYENLIDDMSSQTGLYDIYYRKDAGDRSQELIDYTYNELCMVLDYEYGLKDSHNIESFDKYFQEIGIDGVSLKSMLKSDDPEDSEKALAYLTWDALDDLHSGYRSPSFYAGYDSYEETKNAIPYGASFQSMISSVDTFEDIRAKILGDENGNIPGYQEIGNTAYVTFDKFNPKTEDYYANPPQSDETDTIGLIIYANSMIKRENSPIENVVIDLSCNTGGAEDAVAFVCAWFLKDAQIYLQNSLTSATAINVYSCDANLDHKFDSDDSVSDLKLFCLISPASFSCGNLAPTVFACSNKVTLIGQTTRGGSCVVLPLTTASGSMLQVSGFKMVSALKNGSFYNSDQGIDPDFKITNIENFYDRNYLTDYINNLP